MLDGSHFVTAGVGGPAAPPQIPRVFERSVLLVDDDDDVRDSLAIVLRDEGYHVETASNGKEALDMLARMPPPGVVLLDLMMPVMNGWTTLQVMRQRRVPSRVVVVSAAVPPPPPGVSDYLRKPVDLDQLLAKVDAAFARGGPVN